MGSSPAPPFYADKFNLLVYADEKGDLHPIRSVQEWQIRRRHILANMQLVMGELPDERKRVPLNVQVLGEHDEGSFLRRKIAFAPEPDDKLMAWLLVPNCEHDFPPEVRDAAYRFVDKVMRHNV